jgi:cytochrome P450
MGLTAHEASPPAGSDAMTTTTDVYYDPYDRDIDADPYPIYRRLREEAPLYYNEGYDFYAVSRFDDVQRGLVDRETYSSARGSVLEFIKANIEMPPGVVIFEDPPQHTVHRGLLSRVFTPKKMNALEPKVREFCARALDPLVGAGRLDFVADLGAQMPMRTIGMLLGIPEADQEEARDRADTALRTDPGKPMDVAEENIGEGDFFSDYIDWRATHPSDDLMTDLLYAEFEDETGTQRRLTRDEVLIYVSVVSGAWNETTNRLIGWMGKVLGEHPAQRRELVEDRSLVPNAIEELLRFEPPTPHVARYVTRDIELYGETVPAGSAIMCLSGSANRDDRRYADPDRFDIRRDIGQHLTFGHGIHHCLGAALARLEGRVALDEVLARFPEWSVDWENARRAPTSTVRGWESLPAFTV